MVSYFVHGPAISKDEIDGALNVTIFEVMPASIVAEGVLSAVETTA